MGAYPGTHLHVRTGTGTATSSTMSRLEAVTTKLSAMRPELERLQAENARLREDRLEKTCDTIRAEADQIRKECELERLRALELERSRWEAREARLEAQLRAAEENGRLSRSMERTPAEVTPTRKFPYASPLLKCQHPHDHWNRK